MSIKVTFSNAATKKPVALMDLHVTPQHGFIIDRQARLYHCENEVLRARLMADVTAPANGAVVYDARNPFRRYVRCQHERVICLTEEDTAVFKLYFRLLTRFYND